MQDHVHFGLPHILFYAASTLIVWNVLRIVAANLADDERTAWLGKGLGGLLTFSADAESVNQ